MTDAALIDRHRQGDQAALGELIQRYQHMLFGYLLRMTRSREDAEDLFQETFLRMVRQLETYDERSRFKSLLFTIAGNLCVDLSRRRQSRLKRFEEEDGDEGIEGLADPSGDWIPDRWLQRKDTAETLVAAVDQLPDAMRDLVLLRLETGMTFQEIADTRGEKLGTILARMHRAVARIRMYFEKQGYETASTR